MEKKGPKNIHHSILFHEGGEKNAEKQIKRSDLSSDRNKLNDGTLS